MHIYCSGCECWKGPPLCRDFQKCCHGDVFKLEIECFPSPSASRISSWSKSFSAQHSRTSVQTLLSYHNCSLWWLNLSSSSCLEQWCCPETRTPDCSLRHCPDPGANAAVAWVCQLSVAPVLPQQVAFQATLAGVHARFRPTNQNITGTRNKRSVGCRCQWQVEIWQPCYQWSIQLEGMCTRNF